MPILETLCQDFLPDVMDVIRANAAHLQAHPGENIPRYLGMHAFTTGGIAGERVISSFSQWMFQRAWSHFHSLKGEDRASAEQLLEDIGGLQALQVDIEHLLKRKPGQLELIAADA
jgi:hypothetical protein